MSEENYREVFRALREHQHKYTYFLLTAAGAAIALAVNQTHGASLGLRQLPLAAGVLSWGASFWCGCQHLTYVSSVLIANGDLISIQGGNHPATGGNLQAIQAAVEGMRSAIEKNANAANTYGHWQFRLFVIGACFYLGWHVLEMYFRVGVGGWL